MVMQRSVDEDRPNWSTTKIFRPSLWFVTSWLSIWPWHDQQSLMMWWLLYCQFWQDLEEENGHECDTHLPGSTATCVSHLKLNNSDWQITMILSCQQDHEKTNFLDFTTKCLVMQSAVESLCNTCSSFVLQQHFDIVCNFVFTSKMTLHTSSSGTLLKGAFNCFCLQKDIMVSSRKLNSWCLLERVWAPTLKLHAAKKTV